MLKNLMIDMNLEMPPILQSSKQQLGARTKGLAFLDGEEQAITQ